MSIRNLDAIFKPTSIALIGASKQERSVGAVVAHNLFNAGFDGPIMPVNPRYKAIEGVLSYPDVASLPMTPDLAIIATPPNSVPGLVRELGARGTRGVIVITAGFSELGTTEGAALEREMLEAAKPHLLRIIGPNCLGVLVPRRGLNASFAHLHPPAGDIAFVAQSGALLTAVLDWAAPRGIGFSHLVALGDMSDVDFGDMLDYLAQDPDTRAILLYLETVTHARKFMSAARSAARMKPMIAIKAGRHAQSAKAAASHTGALAGADEVFDAAFRRAGMLRVFDLDELFDAVETLAAPPPLRGDRLAILTNGGGLGVLATDSLLDLGGKLAELSDQTIARLDAVLPRIWSRGNPVDIIGDAPGKRYADALEILLTAPEVDAVLVLNCPTAVASSVEAAEAVVAALGPKPRPVLTSWIGGAAAGGARRLFAARRIPTYETPDKAVRGFMHLVRYRRNQEMLMQVPASVPGEFETNPAEARTAITAALSEGREWLSPAEVRHVLASYGITAVKSRTAGTPEEVARCAVEIGGPVALKIVSPDILHKSDVGGVMLDLATPDEAREAARVMIDRIRRLKPGARITGFTVEEMIRRPHAHELIVGMVEDRQFGPFILFGHGGVAVEVMRDKAVALPPLNMALAHELMSRTRVFDLLKGYRDQPPAALDEIALTLVRVSHLAAELDEIVEIDINPLLADPQGVIALDARIRVRTPAGPRGAARLAIRPYPKELEEAIDLPDVGKALLRPVRPEDEPAFHAAFAKLSDEDVRMRFFAPLKTLPRDMAARLTQIDYDREMAFVLEQLSDGAVIGVGRLVADPDGRKAEFAVIVRSDLKGRGIGRLLMTRIVDYARHRGIGELFGDILRENTAMLALMQEMGFEIVDLEETEAILRARMVLSAPAVRTDAAS
ncbi:MAG TPA: bifunctional acetate--CoA ligase family protein/GNAT family N-acetyltransferase [Alphaproteobacteria bacterium]